MSNSRAVVMAIATGVVILLCVVLAASFVIGRMIHSVNSQPAPMGGDALIEKAGGAVKVMQEAEVMFARYKTDERSLLDSELDRFPAFSAFKAQIVTVSPRTPATPARIHIQYGNHWRWESIFVFETDPTNTLMLPTNALPINPRIFVTKKEH